MISGNYIDSLNQITEFPENACIMMSEHDIYIYDWFNSVFETCDEFITDAIPAISSRLNLGSMAFELTSNYALAGHNHNDKYTLISSFTGVYSKDNSLSIGNFFNNGIITPVYVGAEAFGEDAELDIEEFYLPLGEFRFTALKTLNSINIQSPSFNGWVYPDGSEYYLSDFVLSTRLESIFKTSNGKFTVPNIGQFIKIDNRKHSSIDDTCQTYNGRTVNAPHSHTATLKISADITMKAHIPIGPHPGAGLCVHNGNNSSSSRYFSTASQTKKIEVDLKLPADSRLFQLTGNNEVSLPNYSYMPAVVFIGKSQWSS